MGMLDFFTGGKSGDATDAMRKAEEAFANVQAPTAAQLTLPELQKYVEAGIITPAQAQSYLQQSNAYNQETVPQSGTQAQIEALNQLSGIANAGAAGTPQEQAQMANAMSQMNTAIGGQEGAIEQGMQARGVPAALVQAALKEQSVGQQGQQAYLNAVNSQGQMYGNALNALSQKGAVGSGLQGQQNTQANTVAGAQNAMQQFNAQNQQQNAQFNAGNTQAANMANAANKQQVSNNNVGNANARTQYNAQVPQTVFGDQMQKASGQAGAYQNIANLAQNQGQQNAGLWGGLINTATSFIPKPGMAGAAGAAGGAAPTGYNPNVAPNQYASLGYAHGGVIRPAPKPPTPIITVGSPRGAHGGYVEGHDHALCMASGGYCMEGGGMVPGDPPSIAGDSLANDQIPIQASPGEAVIPRSSVAQNPEAVNSLLGNQDAGPQIDFQDVATLLKAMRSIRLGVA